MDFKNTLLSNKWYIIGLAMFFIIGYFIDQHFFIDKFQKIKSETGLTIGQITKKSYAAQDCDMVYLYKVNGQYYRGKTPCSSSTKICNKYLIAYSKKEPHTAVLIKDRPLKKDTKIGADLTNDKNKISDNLLNKWIEIESPYIDEKFRKIEISKQFETCE